jgi:hypothetical protein
VKTPAILLLAALALAPARAHAHALDEYVQASRVALTKTGVTLDLELTPGAQVAASIIALIDRDHDLVISADEAAAYGARVLGDLTVTVDGQRVALTLTHVDAASIGEMQEGMGTIRMTASGVHGVHLGSRARLSFRNDHVPASSVYLANALVPADRSLSVLKQERDWYQRSIEVAYDVQPGMAGRVAWGACTLAVCLVLIGVRRRRSRV